VGVKAWTANSTYLATQPVAQLLWLGGILLNNLVFAFHLAPVGKWAEKIVNGQADPKQWPKLGSK